MLLHSVERVSESVGYGMNQEFGTTSALRRGFGKPMTQSKLRSVNFRESFQNQGKKGNDIGDEWLKKVNQ